MELRKRRRVQGAKPMKAEAERGFTLIETAIALLVMMIVMLGVASVFAFAVFNNSNGTDRAQTLAVAQQRLETLRNLKFSDVAMDDDLKAGDHTLTVRRGQGDEAGRKYKIDWTVVDNETQTLKTITVNVTPITAGPAWASLPSWATVSIVTQRAKTDQP
jgi:Tfp pilus assembly protein PilV